VKRKANEKGGVAEEEKCAFGLAKKGERWEKGKRVWGKE